MSSMLETLMQDLSGDVTSQIAGKIGADSGTTQTAINSALPMIMGALGRNASSGEGLQSLTGLLDQDHDGSILDDLMGAVGNNDMASMGQNILGQVLGSTQGAVEKGVSQTSGLSSESSGQLIGMLMPIIMGALGKQSREEGLDADGISGLLGGLQSEADSSLGGLTKFLDADGDGSIIDDVMSMGSKMLGGLFGNKK